MRLARTFPIVLLLGFWSCALSQEPAGGFYRGQVVDMDSGKPIPGVLVVFIWERQVYSPTTKRIHTEIHAVTEVFTDANGRFEISVAPETSSLGPSVVEIRRKDPVFFAPGYLLIYKGQQAKDGSMSVYLKQAKNPSEERENLGILSPLFPFTHTPLFLKALNAERVRLGLQPIQPGKERRGQ